MSSKKDNEPAFELPANLESLGWTAVENFYSLFTKLWTPVHLLLAAGGLVIALYYGNALRLSLLSTHRSVAAALSAKLEPTRNTDQGISAFLLSGVKGDWSRPEYLYLPEVNSALQDVDRKVREVAAEAKATESAKMSAAGGQARLDSAAYVRGMIDKLQLEVMHSGARPAAETWQTAIVSARRDSFMVVPAMSLRRGTLNELPLEVGPAGDESRLIGVLQHNPEVLFDLNLASELEPIMQRMDGASGERLGVIQTYFITESGVFLIRANGVSHQGDYYKDEFQPYTQYMDRPYFWRAVDAKQSKFAPFDYVTKPYLDLGGNGFVVTFSKKFALPNGRVGVLCVDAKLPPEVTSEVERHIESLGAKVSDFYWSKDKGVEPGKDGPPPAEFSWFERLVRESEDRDARSDALGNVATEPQQSSPARPQGEGEGGVRFTVPVASFEPRDGVKRTRLLWVEFDPARVMKRLTKNLLLFTAGIILVIAVTWSLFWDYAVLKREMSNVLDKMSKVMRDASTPFVWLNEKNEFVKVNRSMLELLGHLNIESLRKQTPTFKGLVTDETQRTYEEVLEISGAGEETGEYQISVMTKDGKVLNVRAHGERIPYPTWWRRGLPHRFGIFVNVSEPEQPAAESETAAGDGAQGRPVQFKAAARTRGGFAAHKL
jgi:PAS domain S-box-containing protein